jgi:hypothetical protein
MMLYVSNAARVLFSRSEIVRYTLQQPGAGLM